eukprot:scaffold5387_cov251-Ochromonas_danica.AAC.3
MNVILQLPSDILHGVYSQWLQSKDLSRLDIACVGESIRELWLTSLTGLRISRWWTDGILFSDLKIKKFYVWLLSHKVYFIEGFLVKPGVLEDLVRELDMESYCPTLRSIEIDVSDNKIYTDVRQLVSDLSVFLSHCHNLEELIASIYDSSRFPEQTCVTILSLLIEKLRENSLVKISIRGFSRCSEHIASLFTKHDSSLRDLDLSQSPELDLIMTTLVVNQTHLRSLNIDIVSKPSMALLMSYLSSAGDLLENLRLDCYTYTNLDDIVLSVSTSCPKLTRFCSIGFCSAESLRRLYQQCPYLQHVSIKGTIETDESSNSVSIDVLGFNDNWAVCLSNVMRRRQYKKVTLRLKDVCTYHRVENLKSMLEPCYIRVESSALETCLISFLLDIPHLNSLLLQQVDNYQYTDATLAAITEHASSLTEMDLTSDYFEQSGCFSDKLLSELIETCQSLKRQSIWSNISCCGLESLVAVSKHSNLSMVNLAMDENASEDMFDELLLDEEVKWPSTLEEGYIKLCGDIFAYKFNKDYFRWIKCR